jgi:uncharacterized integral membrane protein
VLVVQSRGYSETYKRFFFKDIQAIIVHRTHMGKTWNGIWGGLFLFFALLALAVQDSVGSGVLLCIAAPFGFGLLVNLILGPMCACSIRTAVQTERITALNRLRASQKFIARIEPLIIAVQGELPMESSNEAATEPLPASDEAPVAPVS